LYRKVNHPAMVLIFDAANIIVRGFTADELLDQFKAMVPGLGWIHIKDYHHAKPVKKGDPIDEDALSNFVPCDRGDSAHEQIFREFRRTLPKLERRLRRRGIPGVFLDLEPHVKGGGQFGGFSGPDGMGVALRSLCNVLDYTDIEYHLRDFDDVKAARGF
ncbi:MAG: sugar phosphate isomerase/epimerase, partial [Pirellulales bacterium]|nr:sugar phosphate isomerase/epimerase [Pirellulales bacterium]